MFGPAFLLLNFHSLIFFELLFFCFDIPYFKNRGF